MAINYNNGNTVRHLKYNGNYVKELKYNGAVAWEDVCAFWTPGTTMPEGVASVAAERYGSKEPSATNYTPLVTANHIYNGDTLFLKFTPASYYTLSSQATTVTMESGVHSTLGADWYLTAEKALSISGITVSKEMRTVTLTFPTVGVYSIYILETDRNYYGSTSLSLWNGEGVHWSATASDGYTLDSTSGTLVIGSGAQTIAPTASAAAATWHEVTDWSEDFSQISWSSTDWSTSGSNHYSTVKKLIPTNNMSKGGLLSYGASNVRVSGTATFTSATGTKYTKNFSNTILSTSTGYKLVTACTFSYSGATVYVYLQLKLTDCIDCRFSVNPASKFPLSSILSATVQLTSIDVKTRFSTGVMDIYVEDNYGFYVDSSIPDQSATAYILGDFAWSDGNGLQSQSFVATGTVQPNGSLYIDNTYFSGSDQVTFNGGQFAVALRSTDGTMLTPPMTYEIY